MNNIVSFKANAGIKDIVGRGLIYDDNIAVIELVKNSKDAGAKNINIIFKNKEILIYDNGKGMTVADIKDRWLNIAYSHKKNDNQIKYAGNKGVGRFSCDRLGKNLNIFTKYANQPLIKLPINWELFENADINTEVSKIELKYEILENNKILSEFGFDNFTVGTILQIKDLRSDWNDKKVSKLISELEKFTPDLGENFDITLTADFLINNKIYDKEKINNNILKKLSFKTTYIKSKISDDGLFIDTDLFYQNSKIYSYRAINPYKELVNIKVEIHYLDTLAKSYFTKNTGVSPNNYGSIFLFYNGFRVSPYGNDKNDWLGLDQRKSQGTARNLGTREVFGRIDIEDSKDKFSVVTSREGLAKNLAFQELISFDRDEQVTLTNGKASYGYITTIIRQLENFVVNGLEWNSIIDKLDPNFKKVITEKDIQNDPNRYTLKNVSKEKIIEVCNKILKSDFQIEFLNIDSKIIEKLKIIAEKKYDDYVHDFVNKNGEKTLDILNSSEKIKLKKVVENEKKKTESAIQTRVETELKLEIAAKEIEIEKHRGNFLEAIASPEKILDALITHVIKQITNGIEKDIKSIMSIYYEDNNSISKNDLIDVLNRTLFDITLIKESAAIATKVDFNLKVSSLKTNLYIFIKEYIEKILNNESRWGLKIHFLNINSYTLIKTFQPVKVCVFLVNLLENASKFNAKNFYIECFANEVHFYDDGLGFDFKVYTIDKHFKTGYTNSYNGSGLGLFHCLKIAKEMKATLQIENSLDTNGALIKLIF